MADQVDSLSDAELRTKLAEHGFPIMPITAATRQLLVKKLKFVLDNKSKPRTRVDNKAHNRRKLARDNLNSIRSRLDFTMADQVDSLSDAELRTKLAEHGFPIMPITAATRQLLVKNLKFVLDNKSKPRTRVDNKAHNRRKLTRDNLNSIRSRLDFTMADQVDSLSDAELRTKLAEHGFPIMPITAATRQFLVKKLKFGLDNKSKPRTSVDDKADNRRTLARYSSGEKSDLDTTTNAKEKRGRRATTGGAMLPPAVNKSRRTPSKKGSPAKRDSDKNSEPEEEKQPVRTHEEVETVTTRTNDQDDYEAGSNSDVDGNKKTSSPFRSNSRLSDYISSTLPTVDVGTSPLKTSVFSRASIIPTKYSSTYSSSMTSSDNLNSIRSRLGLTSTLGDRPSIIPTSNYTSTYTSTYQPSTSTIDEAESPYLSNFTRRLSALKSDPPKSTSYLDRDTNNGSTVLPRRSYITGVNRSDIGSYKSYTDKQLLKNYLVSLDLVVLVALFIFCLFFSFTLVIIALLTLLALGLQRAYKYYMLYQKRKSEEIYSMVEQIIDVISQGTEDSGEPYISVNHVRDTLILPQNRASVWDAAVKFIQKNESRVRMEVQSVDGEDCRVWRWISSHSPKRSASWQGQAFETREGSVNNLVQAPTPCLKIRSMFDKNGDSPLLKMKIQDAILEKCESGCKILHIEVERSNCCVYVKCASPGDAGVVYRSLHGWWYEGRLITVKYLRLERYMQRFPNSPYGPPYLTTTRGAAPWGQR